MIKLNAVVRTGEDRTGRSLPNMLSSRYKADRQSRIFSVVSAKILRMQQYHHHHVRNKDLDGQCHAKLLGYCHVIRSISVCGHNNPSFGTTTFEATCTNAQLVDLQGQVHRSIVKVTRSKKTTELQRETESLWLTYGQWCPD